MFWENSSQLFLFSVSGECWSRHWRACFKHCSCSLFSNSNWSTVMMKSWRGRGRDKTNVTYHITLPQYHHTRPTHNTYQKVIVFLLHDVRHKIGKWLLVKLADCLMHAAEDALHTHAQHTTERGEGERGEEREKSHNWFL